MKLVVKPNIPTKGLTGENKLGDSFSWQQPCLTRGGDCYIGCGWFCPMNCPSNKAGIGPCAVNPKE